MLIRVVLVTIQWCVILNIAMLWLLHYCLETGRLISMLWSGFWAGNVSIMFSCFLRIVGEAGIANCRCVGQAGFSKGLFHRLSLIIIFALAIVALILWETLVFRSNYDYMLRPRSQKQLIKLEDWRTVQSFCCTLCTFIIFWNNQTLAAWAALGSDIVLFSDTVHSRSQRRTVLPIA